ncbi:MAG: hypothetical protein ACR2OB_13405 [Solirubrobacteraceae bacterium]
MRLSGARPGGKASVAVLLLCGAVPAGCGLAVRSPDLFLLTRSGQGKPLALLVSDGGTIRCNSGKAKPLSDHLLIQARALATDLDKDAKARLAVAASRGSVFSYTLKLQDGTISFPDTAAGTRHELSEAEQFAVQAGHLACQT